MPEGVRKFDSGATRGQDDQKLDMEGFFSSVALEGLAKYMHKHRLQTDGSLRASDNWQNHFGPDHFKVCMKSMWRHFHSLWKAHRELPTEENLEDSLMGLLFNVMAYADKYYKDDLTRLQRDTN